MARRRRAVEIDSVSAAGEVEVIQAPDLVEIPEPQPEPTELAVRFVGYTTHAGQIYTPGAVATLPIAAARAKIRAKLAVEA